MNSIVGQRLEDFRIGHGVTARRDGRGEGRSLASVVNSAAEQWPYYHAYRVCPLPSTLPRTPHPYTKVDGNTHFPPPHHRHEKLCN